MSSYLTHPEHSAAFRLLHRIPDSGKNLQAG